MIKLIASDLDGTIIDKNNNIFDSNLKFSFDDLINEFENHIGETITHEFLNQRYQDSQDEIIPSGIYLELYDDDSGYGIKFTIYYKAEEYTIYK